MGLREFSKKQSLRNSIISAPRYPGPEQQDDQYPLIPEPELHQKVSVPEEEELVRESPRKLASLIKRKPSPKGALGIKIGGRPIDLHQLEKYLVWQISPYILSTINSYNSSRQIEQMQNYRRKGFSQVGATKKGSGRLLMWLVIFGALLGLGVILLLYMPQIMNFFRGFGGSF